jgi:hypothetical protein
MIAPAPSHIAAKFGDDPKRILVSPDVRMTLEEE